MSTLKIEDFKSKLSGGGARPNLFKVVLDPGAYKDKLEFLCKAAQLPASNIGPIDVAFRGRILKVAGDRTFDPWTITVINDRDFELRHIFEKWMNDINELTNNGGRVNPSDYFKDGSVVQLGRQSGSGDGEILRTYDFKGMFPTNVSAIDLSYDSSDTIEEFTVDLQVTYFTIKDGPGAIS
jgi:hypothetical protein